VAVNFASDSDWPLPGVLRAPSLPFPGTEPAHYNVAPVSS